MYMLSSEGKGRSCSNNILLDVLLDCKCNVLEENHQNWNYRIITLRSGSSNYVAYLTVHCFVDRQNRYLLINQMLLG